MLVQIVLIDGDVSAELLELEERIISGALTFSNLFDLLVDFFMIRKTGDYKYRFTVSDGSRVISSFARF